MSARERQSVLSAWSDVVYVGVCVCERVYGASREMIKKSKARLPT